MPWANCEAGVRPRTSVTDNFWTNGRSVSQKVPQPRKQFSLAWAPQCAPNSWGNKWPSRPRAWGLRASRIFRKLTPPHVTMHGV